MEKLKKSILAVMVIVLGGDNNNKGGKIIMNATFLLLVSLFNISLTYALVPDTIVEKSGKILTGSIILRKAKPMMIISPSGNYPIRKRNVISQSIYSENTFEKTKHKTIFFPMSRDFLSAKAKKLYIASIIFGGLGITMTSISYFGEKRGLRYIGFPSIFMGIGLVIPAARVEGKREFFMQKE
jgi:hypothetical protein